MFQRDAVEAQNKLDSSGITFKRKGGGYFYPDRLVDRNAISLVGVQYRPSRNPDEVISQFADKAWIEILDSGQA